MMHSLISNIKRVLPAVLVCGGLFAALYIFPAAVSADDNLTDQSAESSVSAYTEDESSVSADAEGESAVSPPDESIPSPEETIHVTREDMRPAGMLYISQGEALTWLHNAVGVSIDFDGAYGAQCVDLLKAYYDYLGVGAQHGNAQDYRSNFLPQGWQRIEGAEPLPGDILIYIGGTYGHVAVYESEYSTYHQNWGVPYVINMTDRPYNAISPGRVYWGVVRPFFPEYAGASPDWIIDKLDDLTLAALRFPGTSPQARRDYGAPLPSVFEIHRERVLRLR
ncbi:MAG: CHAP domain-containing protein [Oscillospiraceae bacterium]|jgi:hypothetical protein|nr:CHAP domain-containing protein [Oscillospiraceae bacterium]MBR3169924.1 CHAP domain-containing protein [Lachnospiraceae bacterium]